MIEIALQQVPNQSLSFDIGGYTFDITLKTTDSIIADIAIDNVQVISGMRVMAFRPIIPYEYLTAESGNVFFITDNGEAPNYLLFGISQTLVFVDATELDFLNAY